MLASFFGWIEGYLTIAFQALHAPDWLYGVLILGLFRGTSWVVSVMSPPMAIFFPAFAPLENYGYLPRVAFNLDRLFKNGCARQAVPHHGDGIRPQCGGHYVDPDHRVASGANARHSDQ